MGAHIEIGTATRLAAQLRGDVDTLRMVKDRLENSKAVYDQLAINGDWASLGGALNVSAEDAQAIYNILGSVVSELGGTFIGQFLGRLG